MSNSLERSLAVVWACSVQTLFAIFATLVSIVLTLLVFLGSAIFPIEVAFKWVASVIVAAILSVPVGLLITSSVMLWRGSATGWYLTIALDILFFVLNARREFGLLQMSYEHSILRSAQPHGHPSANLFLMTLLITVARVLLPLAPPILLALPESRREYFRTPTLIPSSN
jgi:hypothetical protein